VTGDEIRSAKALEASLPNHRGIPIRPFRRLGWLWGGEFLLAD